MNINWLEILEKVIEATAFSVASAAVLYFITWIKAKKQELENKINDEKTKKYLDLLEQIITECVLATNQTYVGALKKSGTFDNKAQKQALQLTYDTVLASLTDEAQSYLKTAVKDLNSYITTKIEAHVCMTKK